MPEAAEYRGYSRSHREVLPQGGVAQGEWSGGGWNHHDHYQTAETVGAAMAAIMFNCGITMQTKT
ncbi:MAG: hypothetical protein EA349_04530 [Halomonadaceae bacterium]|nr:MAG: hypothetical protein EA349_04530 [Halomonadaceae bacterium]